MWETRAAMLIEIGGFNLGPPWVTKLDSKPSYLIGTGLINCSSFLIIRLKARSVSRCFLTVTNVLRPAVVHRVSPEASPQNLSSERACRGAQACDRGALVRYGLCI